MDELITGAILAAASGLAFIAYRHPEAYARIYWWLMGLGAVVLALVLFWYAAVSQAYQVLLPFMMEWEIDAATQAYESVTPDTGRILIGYLAFNVYVAGLSWVPALIGNDNRKGPD